MTPLLPELVDLPAGVMLDGELVAFADGRPHFPLVCDRLLRGDSSIALMYVIFDVLAVDGEPVVRRRDVRGRRRPARTSTSGHWAFR
jgi:ATP-dependent DNA ligase